MKISGDQKAAMDEGMLGSFEDRMITHLERHAPHTTRNMKEKDVRERIREGVLRAARHNIVVERDMARFITMMFVVSPVFDTHADMAWTQPILDDEELEGKEKMDRIEAELPDRLLELGRKAKGLT